MNLIDIDTALARLVEMNAWQGEVYQPDMLAVDNVGAVTDVATEPAVGTVVTGSAVPGSEGSAGGGVTGSEGSTGTTAPEFAPLPTGPVVEPMPPETIPIDSIPVETYPAPEARTVTLVDVQADMWWVWDVDNVLWLLPAYRFIDTDGGWHVVPAVTDEFLIEVEPPVMEVEPAEEPTEPVEEVVPEMDIAMFEGLVGLPIDEFTAQAEALGATVRVTEIDGEPQMATRDYRPNRVNVAVTTTDGVQVVTAIESLG